MVARKRKGNESFRKYRENLGYEHQDQAFKLMGEYVWDSEKLGIYDVGSNERKRKQARRGTRRGSDGT